MHKTLLVVCALLVCLFALGVVSAQESARIEPNVVLIDSFDNLKEMKINVQPGSSVIFRLTKCPKDGKSICAIEISASGTQSRSTGLVCTSKWYNGFGTHIATQKVTGSINWNGSSTTWTSLPNSYYWAAVGYGWTGFTASIVPAPNIPFGGSGYANTYAGLIFGGTTYHLTQVSVTNASAQSWHCTGF